MVALYSIVLVIALLGAAACCYYIVHCSDDVDRSDVYHYDSNDYMDIGNDREQT